MLCQSYCLPTRFCHDMRVVRVLLCVQNFQVYSGENALRMKMLMDIYSKKYEDIALMVI